MWPPFLEGMYYRQELLIVYLVVAFGRAMFLGIESDRMQDTVIIVLRENAC